MDCSPLKKKKGKGRISTLELSCKTILVFAGLTDIHGSSTSALKSINQWDKEINTIFGILIIGKEL